IARISLVSSHPEVYDPCDDSFALVDALLAERNKLAEHRPLICLEIGCGSGYVLTSLALILGNEGHHALHMATDINPHALTTTGETVEAHGCFAEVLNADIAAGLEKRLSRSVDVIVVNPPYVPTPEEEVGRRGIASAWAGGESGRSVIDRILTAADELLSDRGWLYMVTLAANNPTELCMEMRKKGFGSRIVLQRFTEEESLQVIKFWRDPDIQGELSARNDRGNGLIPTFNPFSFWKRGNRNV
ncbi:hypothetical protein M569_15642, partial [Genlisea aurea]